MFVITALDENQTIVQVHPGEGNEVTSTTAMASNDSSLPKRSANKEKLSYRAEVIHSGHKQWVEIKVSC